MPWWWGWWRGGWPRSQSQEIAHGTARTDIDGTFKIEFTAKPDPKVPEKDEPTFVFQINADVTDSAGETRSADRAIRVGYTALEAMISAEEWQTDGKPVELKLETKTLDGEPQVAEGSVKIYDLQAPDNVHRPPLADYEPWRYGGKFGGGGAGEDEPARTCRTRTTGLWAKWSRRRASPPTPMAWRSCRSSWPRARIARCWKPRTASARRSPADSPSRCSTRRHEAGDQDSALAGRARLGVQPGQEFMALWGTGYERGGRSSRSSSGTK